MNIAFLIPSKGELWNCIEESFLYKYTLKSLKPEEDQNYHFFIGFDNNDIFYKNKSNQDKFKKKFSKYNFKFIEFSSDIMPGHLTEMWNILFNDALVYNKEYIDYFYQCGDDILFKTRGWIREGADFLKNNNDIGVVGPKNNHPTLLTQVMFSRKHYTFFNYLFPKEIFNWGCDDWINNIYSPNNLRILENHYCENVGGAPRYDTSKYNLKVLKNTIKQKALNEKYKILGDTRRTHPDAHGW